MITATSLTHSTHYSPAYPGTAPLDVSIVLPCLNEAETLAFCLEEIWNVAESNHLSLEIVVADNGSTDESRHIAEQSGARIVSVTKRGYGNALLGGIRAARGRFVIIGDADGSYDFNDILRILDQLQLGYELVMGNRFYGGIQRNAMPPLCRYLGNPVLSTLGRVLFKLPLQDFHCGLRGFDRQAAQRWRLNEPGVEFTSEMIIKAALHKARIAEVPVSLRPDRRSRPPHLHPWLAGWRHLNLMCRYFFRPPIA